MVQAGLAERRTTNRDAALGPPRHPIGRRAHVLLSSVFGPYAQDDEYGSRAVNPMELYHNQVTRVQGGFSLRMFHRSFGLLLIQENIDAPCTVLDFPTLEGFAEELRAHEYDVVGISAIVPNVGKVKAMCEAVRRLRPGATIVVGGHVAALSDLEQRIDADHIVRGDGVSWMRGFLGQDPAAPLRHPAVLSGFGSRILGIPLPGRPKTTAAILIPSVGCPIGCNFCSTSAMFGGKGRHLSFYETGDELFAVMCDIESKLGTRSFFVLDENFLLHRKRAVRLLERMREQGKAWSLMVFSSAKVLGSWRIEDLVGLGLTWAWLGIEGKESRYAKLQGVDTLALVRTLQSHGIRVLGSTIIGLENHRPGTMDEAIDHAVAHDTDFHQFMLYTPVPGTPFYEEMKRDGRLLGEDECPVADVHGQSRFNYRHPHLEPGTEGELLLSAFRRDFEVNGPSLVRMIRTVLAGWLRYRDHPDARIRERFQADGQALRAIYPAAVWATRRWYRRDARMAAKLDALLGGIYDAMGWRARLAAAALGPAIYALLAREERRLARGWTCEPPTLREENATARALAAGRG